jgi:hypothetical protein
MKKILQINSINDYYFDRRTISIFLIFVFSSDVDVRVLLSKLLDETRGDFFTLCLGRAV